MASLLTMISRWGCLYLLILSVLISLSLSQKERKNARSYSSSSSSSNLYGGSPSSSGGDGYNDNFDSMFNSMDLNNNGNTQKVKISLPNPPHPPKPPRPMKSPNMGNYENDPNRMPNMPRPPAPPAGFGPMDIEFNFPSYEPNVDDSFFDSDQSGSASYGSTGNNYGSSSNNGYSGSNSGSSNYGNNNNNNNGYSNLTKPGNSSTTASYGSSYGSTSCSPKTQPAISNGICVVEAQVTTKCRNGQLAQSSNCKSGEYCCFNNAGTTVAMTAATTSSSSSMTKSTATTAKITTQTSTAPVIYTSLSTIKTTSVDAGGVTGVSRPSNFTTISITSSTSTTKAAPATGGYSTLGMTSVGPNGAACSPLSNPSVTNGLCYNLNALQANCRGIQMSKSSQCAFNQFCCFSSPNAGGQTTSMPGAGTTSSPTVTVAPTTTPFVTTTASVPVSSTVSASLMTTTYSSSSNSTAAGNRLTLLKSCQPQGKPTSVTGQCVANSQLTEQCAGHSVAFADVCANEEACCFIETPIQSTTCRPRSAAANSIAIGECMPTSSLSIRCKNRAASKSDDCAGQDWCCIGQQDDANTSSKITLLGTADGQATIGGGLQVVGSSATGSSSASGSAIQLVSASSNSSADVCTPNDNTGIHNGICLTMRQLSQQCVDKKASSSADCSFGRFCCYSDDQAINQAEEEANKVIAPVVAGTVAPPPATPAKKCSPNSNRAISNGACMTIRELRANCVDQKASPSADCDMGSWCCFVEDGSALVESSEQVNKEIQAVVTEAPAPVVEVEVSTAGSAGLEADQRCVPNSKPDISNGVCMPTKDLRVRCKNQRVSKSPGCKMGHWCCFADSGNPVSVTVNDFSRNINAL